MQKESSPITSILRSFPVTCFLASLSTFSALDQISSPSGGTVQTDPLFSAAADLLLLTDTCEREDRGFWFFYESTEPEFSVNSFVMSDTVSDSDSVNRQVTANEVVQEVYHL